MFTSLAFTALILSPRRVVPSRSPLQKYISPIVHNIDIASHHHGKITRRRHASQSYRQKEGGHTFTGQEDQSCGQVREPGAKSHQKLTAKTDAFD
jgi:hypothetical protein